MKYWKTAFYILGTFPLLFCISMLTFYFHAAVILGYLPRYNQPDPAELDIYRHYLPIITWLGNVWIISFLPWFILIIVYLILKRKQIQWKPVIISLIGQLCIVALFLSGIVEWFAD